MSVCDFVLVCVCVVCLCMCLSCNNFCKHNTNKCTSPGTHAHQPTCSSCQQQVVYYDGQFDDARYNVALALTATLAGATVVNHAKVTRLIKDADGQVVGAAVRDTLTGMWGGWGGDCVVVVARWWWFACAGVCICFQC